MIPKKELVAQRFDVANNLHFFVGTMMVSTGGAGGFFAIMGISAIAHGGIDNIESIPFLFEMVGASAILTNLIGQWDFNKAYLYDSVHAGKTIDKKMVKRHLTWKGRIALLPYVGRFVDPRNILSKDAPYTFVRYDKNSKTALELDTAKDPMVSWDALMQSELGVTVTEALNSPKKFEEMQVS